MTLEEAQEFLKQKFGRGRPTKHMYSMRQEATRLVAESQHNIRKNVTKLREMTKKKVELEETKPLVDEKPVEPPKIRTKAEITEISKSLESSFGEPSKYQW